MEKKRRQVKKLWIALAVLVLAALAAVLIWSASLHREVTPVTDNMNVSSDDVSDWKRAIAYVPLDDRTDNIQDVVHMAEASGFQIVLPPGDTYCTKLDGQPLNSNGTQYGDREALFTWVQEMEAKGCNLYILSLDQLFSGGLVNSRSISGTAELTFDDGTVMTEAEAFDRYILSLANDPENRLYLFDSVVRLASTVGYQGYELEEYYSFRFYGMEPRPVLSGDDLTLDKVFAAYRYGEDGVSFAQDGMDSQYSAGLTDRMIDDYLNVRMRKLRLTDHVLSALKASEYDNIRLLIGIDDSSNTNNIQANELNYIAQQSDGKATVMAGLDSLGRLLVAKLAQDQYGGHQINACLQYIGGSQSIPSSEYDRYTLEETVNLHLELFGAHTVDAADAELEILVMTAPSDESRAQEYCEELVSRLEYNTENHIPTILVEASGNAYGEALEDMLFERVDFASLLAFSGRYYQANVTGVGFSMGFSRYFYLACQPDKDGACDDAHMRQITSSLALTYPYVIHSRQELSDYVSSLGCDYNNILAGSVKASMIQDKLESTFLSRCEKIFENLESGRMITSIDPYTEKEVGSISIHDVYFPWNRTFELTFTVDVK